MNAQELISTTGSVAVATRLKRKEAEALAQVFSPNEKPLLIFGGFDKRDKTTKKIILTDKSLYFVRSKIFRAAKVEAVSLQNVTDIQEKRGIFLAKVAIMTKNTTINIDNVEKKASAKLVSVWREINGQHGEAKQNIPAPEPKKSGLFEKVYKVAVLVIAVLFIKNMIDYKPAPKNEETQPHITASANSGKIAINLNTGEIATSKPQPKKAQKDKTGKMWFEGGTLHQATVKEWRNATKENKLATCADFVAGQWKTDKLRFSISDMDGLKYYAQELVDFIDTSTEDIKEINNHKITEIAAMGFFVMNWLKE